VSSFAGLGATFFPYLVPGTITVFEAAAAPNTLVFMLAIVSFFIPIMIFYNAYQYAVFSGKLEEYTGYGEGNEH
jgi:cytochrome d ubiquinol oxidase subunit II